MYFKCFKFTKKGDIFRNFSLYSLKIRHFVVIKYTWMTIFGRMYNYSKNLR